MVSLNDILTISLIVLVIFSTVAVVNLMIFIKSLKEVVGNNKKSLENILTDVSKLTKETVTLEERIKGYIIDLVTQFLSGKNKEEK